MMMTQQLINALGPRSIQVRTQLVRSGDKSRISALRKALIAIGAYEMTRDQVVDRRLRVVRRKYGFMQPALNFALLTEYDDVDGLTRIDRPVDIELAHIKHGVIGLDISSYPETTETRSVSPRLKI